MADGLVSPALLHIVSDQEKTIRVEYEFEYEDYMYEEKLKNKRK